MRVRSALGTLVLPVVLLAMILVAVITRVTHAAPIPSGDFSLEVSPSVLSSTVKPGMQTTLELKVRNASLKPERLKIEARNIRSGTATRDVTISEKTPADLAEWVSYSNPTFVVEPGEWFTQRVTVSLPEEAGFSYPFALVISRIADPAGEPAGRQLKGSIAVFALVNVDKPGATRRLQVEDLKTSQNVYEYLPTNIELKLRNVGNSIVQPYGNVYIQRGSVSTEQPLSVLPVNEARGYVLPGTTRLLSTTWDKGFPVYKTDSAGNKSLVWDWPTLSQFRIGKYTAKVVAVYNDGQRDVPVIAETSFWVIPWRLLLGGFVVGLLLGFSLWMIARHAICVLKKVGSRRPTS